MPGSAGAVRPAHSLGEALLDADAPLCEEPASPRSADHRRGQGAGAYHRRRLSGQHSARAAEDTRRRISIWRRSRCCRCSNGWRRPAASRMHEMLRTFNCGIGMIAVVAPDKADAVLAVLARARRNRDARSARWCRRKAKSASPIAARSISHCNGMARKRTAILISGRGSNMTALIEAAKDAAYPAEIVLVVSNRPDAAGLAARRGRRHRDRDRRPHPLSARIAKASSARFRPCSNAIASTSSVSPASCGC